MANIDPGLMRQQIDFWDQPSEPNSDGSKQDPVLFASGVFAQILGIWSATSQAKKLAQQVVSELSHEISIQYMAGLRTRMFIIYNDADNGARRFDIDRIVDLDETKVQLHILAIERNDGQ